MAKEKVSKFKLPGTLAQCADLLWTTRLKRLEVAKQADLLADQESQLKEHLVNKLPKSQASGIAGRVARVTVSTKEVPSVKDWDKLQAYIKKTGAFELLGRSVSKEAIRERWDAGKTVPGVERFKAVVVNVNKV